MGNPPTTRTPHPSLGEDRQRACSGITDLIDGRDALRWVETDNVRAGHPSLGEDGLRPPTSDTSIFNTGPSGRCARSATVCLTLHLLSALSPFPCSRSRILLYGALTVVEHQLCVDASPHPQTPANITHHFLGEYCMDDTGEAVGRHRRGSGGPDHPDDIVAPVITVCSFDLRSSSICLSLIWSSNRNVKPLRQYLKILKPRQSSDVLQGALCWVNIDIQQLDRRARSGSSRLSHFFLSSRFPRLVSLSCLVLSSFVVTRLVCLPYIPSLW